jgi:hypothetical protein
MSAMPEVDDKLLIWKRKLLLLDILLQFPLELPKVEIDAKDRDKTVLEASEIVHLATAWRPSLRLRAKCAILRPDEDSGLKECMETKE